jgi:hypothetical protein
MDALVIVRDARCRFAKLVHHRLVAADFLHCYIDAHGVVF